MLFFRRKKEEPPLAYDPAEEEPVIRASICTGEREGGFRNRKTGAFRAVTLIRNEQDKMTFCRRCGILPEEAETIY